MEAQSPPGVRELQRTARGLTEEIYGAWLRDQGSGFYVTLELLAVVWGIEEHETEELFGDPGDDLRFKRRSHDFARRLLNGDHIPPERRHRVSDDDDCLEVIGDVFDALTVQFEFQKMASPPASRRHLRPYLGELIHHDFAEREGNEGTDDLLHERVWYRGGGALVYELLRTDPDPERRDRTAAGLRRLAEDSNDAVGRIAKILHSEDALVLFSWEDEDLIRHTSDRETGWAETLRDGTSRILSSDAPAPKTVDHLMYWLPYCLARHLVERAFSTLGIEEPPTPVDTGAGGALRRASQRRFVEHRNVLRQAVLNVAGSEPDTGAPDPVRRALHKEEFPKGAEKQVENTLGAMGKFFASTMAGVGALNHNSGLRHYTFKLPLLESIVHATVERDAPIDFEDFCSGILCRKLRLVVDPASGQEEGTTAWIDNEDLERNASGLADRLDSLGLITNYSDATRKVGPRR